MRNILILVFSLIAFGLNAQNNYEITYSIDIKANKKISKRKPDQIDKRMHFMKNKMIESAEHTDFKLIFNEQMSYFKTEEKVDKDNDINSSYARGILASLNAAFPIYTDLSNKKVYKKVNVGEVRHLICLSLRKFNWKITETEKIIEGYTLKKAIAKVKNHKGFPLEIEAWFAPQIPFSYGPVMFNGLPGLIVELHAKQVKDNKKYSSLEYSFYFKSLKKRAHRKIEIPFDAYKTVRPAESETIFAKMNGNFKPN